MTDHRRDASRSSRTTRTDGTESEVPAQTVPSESLSVHPSLMYPLPVERVTSLHPVILTSCHPRARRGAFRPKHTSAKHGKASTLVLATGPRGPVAIVRRHPCGPDQPRDHLLVTCPHRRYIVGHVTGRLRTLHVGYGRYIGYTLVTAFVTFGYILSTLLFGKFGTLQTLHFLLKTLQTLQQRLRYHHSNTVPRCIKPWGL